MKQVIFLIFAFCLLGCQAIIQTTTKPSENRIGFYYLPLGVLKIEIIRLIKDDKTDFCLNCQSQIIPDISQKYYLSYSQSFNSNDNIQIEFDSKNFLKKVKIESEDVTDELIVKISEIATEALKMATSLPSDTKDVKIDTVKTIYYSINQKDEKLDEEILKYKIKIKVKKLSLNGDLTISDNTITNFNGILYRPIIPYLIEITNEKDELIKSQVTYLPDDEIVKFDITRASFVKKVTEIDFENGSISKFSINKPSQSLELASIPIDILKSITAIPTDLIQLKINLSSKNKELIKAQQSEIAAKNELIEYLKSLREKDNSSDINTGKPY